MSLRGVQIKLSTTEIFPSNIQSLPLSRGMEAGTSWDILAHLFWIKKHLCVSHNHFDTFEIIFYSCMKNILQYLPAYCLCLKLYYNMKFRPYRPALITTYLNARAEVSRVIGVVVVVLADALAELSRQPLLPLCTQLKQFPMVRVLISMPLCFAL